MIAISREILEVFDVSVDPCGKSEPLTVYPAEGGALKCQLSSALCHT